MTGNFSHFDGDGNAVMVDVSDKSSTARTAVARGTIRVGREVLQKIRENQMKKGDVLGVARIAGIMGVKKTSELIPLCHPLSITKCTIDFETDSEQGTITVFCTVSCHGTTGVEMEALTGVQITLLTIYDMCKALNKNMVMDQIHLVKKTGGKSGDFHFGNK